MTFSHQNPSHRNIRSLTILLLCATVEGFGESMPSIRTNPPTCQLLSSTRFVARVRSKRLSRDKNQIDDFSKNEGRKAVQDLLGEEALQDESSSEASDKLLAEVMENQPSGFQVASDVMGFNALTYVLAFLIALSGAANVFLGDGWLLPIINPDMAQEQREAVDARRQQEIDPRTYPSGYQSKVPSTEELLKNIPAEDLKRLQEGNLPIRGAASPGDVEENILKYLKDTK